MKNLFFYFLYLTSFSALADYDEDKIISINNTYAKCGDAVHGNFDSDIESQIAMKTFYKLTLDNINIILDSENDDIVLMGSILGGDKGVLAGYMLAASINSGIYNKNEKEEIMNNLGLGWREWRELNQHLWKINGCEAILDIYAK